MTPEQRDDALVAAVANYGGEWVAADTAKRSVPGLSAIAAGRHLARLAREGRVEVRVEYMNHYRVLPSSIHSS